MHDTDPLTGEIISAAIAVSRGLGVGLLESVYATCLAHELGKRSLGVSRQPTLPVIYSGVRMEMAFRPDLIIQQEVIVEVKAVTGFLPLHQAQLLNYMRLSAVKKGLLFNFTHSLRQGNQTYGPVDPVP